MIKKTDEILNDVLAEKRKEEFELACFTGEPVESFQEKTDLEFVYHLGLCKGWQEGRGSKEELVDEDALETKVEVLGNVVKALRGEGLELVVKALINYIDGDKRVMKRIFKV